MASDQEWPGGIAADIGRGQERVQRIANDLDLEQAPERDLPEMGVLDDVPGPSLQKEPGEAEADDD